MKMKTVFAWRQGRREFDREERAAK